MGKDYNMRRRLKPLLNIWGFTARLEAAPFQSGAHDFQQLGKKTGNPQSGMMPEAHSNRRFPNRMTLTQVAFML